MKLETDEADVISRIVRWAESHELVRAVLLTSSRVNPGAPRDILSDYDVELVVSDTTPFAESDDWSAGVGTPLLQVRDTQSLLEHTQYNCMVLYDDGVKIDYSVWPVAVVQGMRDIGRLTDELDLGYRIILDKDNLLRDLPAPTYTAHIPEKPTEHEFQNLVQEFWFVATYVAKYLWRDEFLPAKVILDHELKWLIVRRMLEWRIEIDHDWSVKPGFFGKGMQRYLDAETWADFQATYVGPDKQDNWAALWKTIALFRRVAIEVAQALGYQYPHATDARVTAYMEQIRRLDS